MQQAQQNLFLRNDTIFGVCEGIGQDFGFNPNYLRIALCIGLFYSPLLMVSIYLGLGVLVLATRFLAPDLRSSPNSVPSAAGASAAAPNPANEGEAEQLRAAA